MASEEEEQRKGGLGFRAALGFSLSFWCGVVGLRDVCDGTRDFWAQGFSFRFEGLDFNFLFFF